MSKKKSDKEAIEKKPARKKATAATKPKEVKAVVASELTASVSKPVKKAPRAKKSPATPPPDAVVIEDKDIDLRAYYIAERRHKMGWVGDSTGDWVEADRQLRAEASVKK